MNIDGRLQAIQSDINDVQSWIDEQYRIYFSGYFEEESRLYAKSREKVALEDNELEWIITSLPMELLAVANNLDKIKVSQEVVKMTIKRGKAAYAAKYDPGDPDADFKIERDMSEDKLIAACYGILIERVEKEMSFAKELIMGAKKVWDTRRTAEAASAPTAELPPYSFPGDQTYIR